MKANSLQQEAEALMSRAKVLRLKDKTAEAIEAYLAAENIWAQLEDGRGRARCWTAAGKAYFKAGEWGKASDAFAQAAHFSAATDWPDKEIEALYNQGLVLEQLGTKGANLVNVNHAIQVFQQALAIARRVQDTTSVGVLLLSLGFDCAWAKRDSEAIAYFQEAVPFALDGVDFDTAFSALSSLGVLLSNHSQASAAIPHYERALALAQSKDGDLVAVADTFANLGIAYEKTGRWDDAIAAIDNYREILHVAGDNRESDAKALLKRLKERKRSSPPTH